MDRGQFLQLTTWQFKRLSMCTFSHMTLDLFNSHAIYLNDLINHVI